MINKILINNLPKKIKKIIQFFFQIKSLLIIFSISVSFYFLIPKFFNFDGKFELINNHLIKQYQIDIIEYDRVKYKIFPSPRLEVLKPKISVNENLNGDTEKVIIFIKVLNLYNSDFFNFKKIYLSVSNFELDIKKYEKLLIFLNNLEKKIVFKNLHLTVTDNSQTIFSIKNLNFNNINLSKLKFDGFVLNNRFSGSFVKNKKNKLNVSFPEIGSNLEIFFEDQSSFENLVGLARITILNTKFSFNFGYSEKLEIKNSILINKFIRTSYDGKIIFEPFFYSDLNFDIQKFIYNSKKIENFFRLFGENKNVIKRLNGDYKINFDNSSFFKKKINKFDINLNLNNGEIKIKNFFLLSGEDYLKFNGRISDLDGSNRLFFESEIFIKNIKEFYKKFDIEGDFNESQAGVLIEGYFNLDSSKVYYSKISFNNKNVSEKKKKSLKIKTENIIKNQVLNIFKFLTIREFLISL